MSNFQQNCPYKVGYIITLGYEDDVSAKELLTRAARQVHPILRRRQFTIPLLKEFFPKSRNLLGINIGGGGGSTREINIRLREASSRSTFLPYESILGTLLHEISHNMHGPHKGPLYKLLDELTAECEDLMSRGVSGTGTGFDAPSSGRVGGRHAGKSLSVQERRVAAVNAAVERARRQALMPAGPRVLGGDSTVQKLLTPGMAGAAAAERRARDNQWCPVEELEGGGGHEERTGCRSIDIAIKAILEVNGTLNKPKSSVGNDNADTNGKRDGDVLEDVSEVIDLTRESADDSSNGRANALITEKVSLEANESDIFTSDESSGWICTACTFLNGPIVLQCAMCLSTRPNVHVNL